jgi:hypothetical protein
MAELAPIEVLIDRIEFLIREDPRLEVAETIGALHLIAYRIANGSLRDDD